MLRKKLLFLCLVLFLISPSLFAQVEPPSGFIRQLRIDTIEHSATAIQFIPGTNESYTINLMTFPFSDGDPGVTYNNKGEVISITLFKVPFFVTRIGQDNCPETMEKTIRISLDFISSQIKIDNRPDVNDLLQFASGTSVDEEVSLFLNSLVHYFPYKTTAENLDEALAGLPDFFHQRYQVCADMSGGVVAVAIIGVVCIWECPIIVGCAIGAGGFNQYWWECMVDQ